MALFVPAHHAWDRSHALQHWQVHLFGKFELRDPVGDLVTLPHRKAEGLFAILLLSKPDGVWREHAAEALWPDRSSDARRVNLRQTLAMLRKCLGPEAIESSRTHCGFAPGFLVISDMEDESLRSGNAFMPGNTGRWFETFRNEGRLDEQDNLPKSAALDCFVETLDWFSTNDPSGMYSMMRSASMASHGISSANLRRLIERAGPSRQLPGWRTLWAAYAAESEGSSALSPEGFRSAMRLGEEHQDYVLALEAAYNLCAAMVVQNRISLARSLAERATFYASKGGLEHMLPRATGLQGIVHVAAGDRDFGLQQMKRAENQEGEFFGRVTMRAMRAFFEASFGLYEEAQNTLVLPLSVAAESGHGMIDMISSLAQATIGSVVGDPLDYVPAMERAIQLSMVMQNSYARTYAHETAGKISVRLGEPLKAKEQFEVAKRIRRHGGMVYTPWDRMRLQRKTS